MIINNAKLTFNATTNSGTLSGTGTLYTKSGATGVYTGIRNTTAGTIPTASKSNARFDGWFTAASGGSKVLNADGSIAGAVSGYTSATAWTTTADRTLYAQFTPYYTCTKRYRLQNADGTYPSSYTADGTESLISGSTCSYSKSVSYYTAKSTSDQMTGNKTLSLDLPRTTYTLTVNRNTTAISAVTGAGTYRWGQSVSISATTASGYDFNGWSQTAGTASTFGSSSSKTTTFTMPKSNATIYADGKQSCTLGATEFSYTGGVQTFTVPSGCSGTYKLEVWGAHGSGNSGGDGNYSGGAGGYSVGNVSLSAGDVLKVVVGGQGGYNGGGSGGPGSWARGGAGGGATHIAKNTGSYTTLSSYGNATTASSYVYIVAGGGGGAGETSGGAGGGTSGVAGSDRGCWKSSPGTQTSGYAFGQGQAGSIQEDDGNAVRSGGGGGGGWYGGGGGSTCSGYWAGGGAGGSGWIGGVTSGTTTAGQQSGNGKAKITKL
jgi:hypothetical protein